MQENSPRPRIVVAGGGAAGFFGAIQAASLAPEAEVLLLERGGEVLSKVRISGGGRCNLTHACWEPKELVKAYPRGHKELLGPFHRFAAGDTVDWFERNGVETKIEDDGRIFPVSDQSASVVECLTETAEALGIQVQLQTTLTGLVPPGPDKPGWEVHTSKGVLTADCVLLATGGHARTWDMLAELGLEVVEPVPSLFTFNIADPRLNGLAGLSVPEVVLTVSGTSLQASGPLLVTHWGVSGPAVLRLSAWGARELHAAGYQATLLVNWVGGLSETQVSQILQEQQLDMARRQVPHSPCLGLPLRLWERLCQTAGIPADRRWADLSRTERETLAGQITACALWMDGKSTFKEEFVTAGGVALREIDFRRFACKKYPGLFMAGEILDIDGITGGYNFQAAWTGGWIAGAAMAEYTTG
ncbi:MAG: NAD(P)/FAD-dependent oxidoreductase [Bacteroidia bacterium]|nr:NAD(P)/FAD-dependent oxidoreductase [Bacteroidia bacterium]